MSTRRRIRILAEIGDCFLIPLADGRKAYAQYLFCHPEYATMVQVFDYITTDEELPLERLATARPMFPPVFVGLNVPVRKKYWRRIGTLPVEEFRFPLFRCTQLLTHGLEPGVFDDWLLWDGKTYTRLGPLPAEYRGLEYLASWSCDRLEDRIATGRNHPFALML